MARSRILAAGGIVFRSGAESLIAVVRLSKGNDWVLPKGKLNPGETPRAAAEREVWEETGYTVSVHEFLGKLKYPTGGRQKVVHFWRMEASKKVHHPLSDVREVDWLPLHIALKRLTRTHERDFLADIGPAAHKTRTQSLESISAPSLRVERDLVSPADRKRPNKAARLASSERSIFKQNKSRKSANKIRSTNSLMLFLHKLWTWLR